MQWEPVLRHDLANAARERVSTVAAELARFDPGASAVELADTALLYGYLALSDTFRSTKAQAAEYLDAASACVTADLPSGVVNGLSAIGWTIHHLLGRFTNPTESDFLSADDPLEELEHLILLRVRRNEWRAPYDLIGGLVGIGVFFLERLPLPTARQGVGLILSHLESLAEESSSGITWHTPVRLLPDNQRLECPDGHYNLGVAHGVPGVVYFLAESIAASIGTATAERLFDGAVKWLLAQQHAPHMLSSYGYWVAPGGATKASRVAWCYGDLGIAAILHHVARRLDRADLLRFARALLDRCLTRSMDHVDAGLCHGALGIAHIFNRIYQTELETRYKDAACHYYESGLSLIRKGQGTMGSSLLEGTLGVALALLSAVEPIEPQWDRRLILSGRPRFSSTTNLGTSPS